MSTDDEKEYRRYFHKNESGHGTEFEKSGIMNDWVCTHGGWIGRILDGDNLTLRHAHGKVTYDRYETYFK